MVVVIGAAVVVIIVVAVALAGGLVDGQAHRVAGALGFWLILIVVTVTIHWRKETKGDDSRQRL